MLLLLATGGGLLTNRRVRALVEDELSHKHRGTAIATGYWVAMLTAMTLFVVPQFNTLTARDAIYWVVTLSVMVAVVTFSYLELRAHRDA